MQYLHTEKTFLLKIDEKGISWSQLKNKGTYVGSTIESY
jgi:hypothetical protein